jgi:hypothetical protein
MSSAIYDDLVDFDDEPDYADLDEDYSGEEMDEMLDELIDSADSEDLAERRRRRQRSRARQRQKPVPTATGKSAYRTPGAGGLVTQKQLQDALTRVGADVKRNAAGIKTINGQLGGIRTRIDGVVTVNAAQSRAIAKLDRQMKIAGALEVVQAFEPGRLDAFQLLKGAAASGVIGGGKGALGNPWVIGGLGLLLRNPAFLGGLTQQPQTVVVP